MPYRIIKRLLDIVFSLLAVLILLPVYVIIVIAIKLGSRGPAVFAQTRAGKDGKPFTLYKFRTMKIDVDPFGASPKSEYDPRLTKTGIFLREYSLDELPQFFNVLKGNMSLVGPRPLYVSQIAEWNDYHKQRLMVKPGLTGLSQVKGRASLTQEAKLDIEVEYVEKQSLWLDIKIIFLTFVVIIKKKGVYEKRYSEEQETRGEK